MFDTLSLRAFPFPIENKSLCLFSVWVFAANVRFPKSFVTAFEADVNDDSFGLFDELLKGIKSTEPLVESPVVGQSASSAACFGKVAKDLEELLFVTVVGDGNPDEMTPKLLIP